MPKFKVGDVVVRTKAFTDIMKPNTPYTVNGVRGGYIAIAEYENPYDIGWNANRFELFYTSLENE